MKKGKVYKKFSEIEGELQRISAKHVRLVDGDHSEIIVGFNLPKKKPTYAEKLREIKRKLSVLPDGIYCVESCDRFGKNVRCDRFYIGKGDYDESEVKERKQPVNENNTSHLLSLDEAVKNIRTAAELRAEVTRLTAEVARKDGEITALKDQLEALKDANQELSENLEAKGPFDGLKGFFDGLAPHLPGIADNFFKLEEKKLHLKQAKLLAEFGYEIPGAKRINGSGAKNGRVKIAQPGSEQWPAFVEYINGLPEPQFQTAMKELEEKYPDVYEAIYPEVYDEVDEEEEEKED